MRVPRERSGDSQEDDRPAEGEVEETEKGYAEAKNDRPAEGEVEETEKGYEEAKEKGCEEGTCPCLKEEERWDNEGWVAWKQYPDNGRWTEEEVRAEHQKYKEDRTTNWWGGTELDREPDGEDKEGKEHRFQYPRGTRAGWGNRMA